jgi:hypothetical protein
MWEPQPLATLRASTACTGKALSYLRIMQKENISVTCYMCDQRLSWLGHVERMAPNRSVRSLYSWKPLGARAVGRPKTRLEDDVKADIKEMMVPNYKTVVQNRTKWKGAAEKTKL